MSVHAHGCSVSCMLHPVGCNSGLLGSTLLLLLSPLCSSGSPRLGLVPFLQAPSLPEHILSVPQDALGSCCFSCLSLRINQFFKMPCNSLLKIRCPSVTQDTFVSLLIEYFVYVSFDLQMQHREFSLAQWELLVPNL